MKLYGASAFLVGLLFGVGLTIADLTDPEKINNFLDVFGNWDTGLLVIMSAALCTTMILFRLVLKREKPVLASTFSLPNTSAIDKKLMGGAALFGAGWGLYGYCPGAVIAAMAYLHTNTFVFLAAMLSGMFIVDLFINKPVQSWRNIMLKGDS